MLPRSALGPDTRENLVALCAGCHERMEGAGWKRAYNAFQGYLLTKHGFLSANTDIESRLGQLYRAELESLRRDFLDAQGT